MEKKINLVELLKDCPKGMELDCTLYDNCTFEEIEDVGYIYIVLNTPSGRIRLSKEGCYFRHDNNAKCVIFPKGKNTWEGFQRPFKDGDIVATTNGLWIGITTGGYRGSSIPTYCVIHSDESFEAYLNYKKKWEFARLANEEEKEKLFKAIKDNGYKWNAETKTLELIEPKFKVGDRIKNIDNCRSSIVVEIKDDCFIIKTLDGLNNSYLTDKLSFSKQDEWELVPNKFDITTFKPFDKVLVRCSSLEKWRIQFFEKYDKTYQSPFICLGSTKYNQCIPYKDNEHLLGTDNDCDEYYKTWE